MIEHELFLRFYGKASWDRPVLRAQPANKATVNYLVFTTPHLPLFRASHLHLAHMKKGTVFAPSVSSDASKMDPEHTLDAFLEIYGSGLGTWHVLQGVSIPHLRGEKLPLSLATIVTNEAIELREPKGKLLTSVSYDAVIPYGELVSLKARHSTELYTKLKEHAVLLRRQRANELISPKEHSPNAFLHSSDYFEGADKDYADVAVLSGTFSRS